MYVCMTKWKTLEIEALFDRNQRGYQEIEKKLLKFFHKTGCSRRMSIIMHGHRL